MGGGATSRRWWRPLRQRRPAARPRSRRCTCGCWKGSRTPPAPPTWPWTRRACWSSPTSWPSGCWTWPRPTSAARSRTSPSSYRPAELRGRIEEAQRLGRTVRLEHQEHLRPPAEPIRLTHRGHAAARRRRSGLRHPALLRRHHPRLPVAAGAAGDAGEPGNPRRGAAVLERGAGDHQRGAAIHQRGTGDHQRGAAIHQRRTGDDERGAPLHQRGAGGRERGAARSVRGDRRVAALRGHRPAQPEPRRRRARHAVQGPLLESLERERLGPAGRGGAGRVAVRPRHRPAGARLRPDLERVLAGEAQQAELDVQAVDRRGRSLRCRVRIAPLQEQTAGRRAWS